MLSRPFLAFAFSLLIIVPQYSFAQDQQASETMQAFDATVAKWEEINTQIQALMTQARTMDRSDAGAMKKLREQFLTLQSEGKALVPDLRVAALAAYREAPNSNKKVTEMLVGIAATEAGNDQYQNASEITDLMIENQTDSLYFSCPRKYFCLFLFKLSFRYTARRKIFI